MERGQESAASAVGISGAAGGLAAGRLDVSWDGWSGASVGCECAIVLLEKLSRVCLCFAIAELGLG